MMGKMATYKEMIEAFHIFAKYAEKGLDDYAEMSATHDELFAGPDPKKVAKTDLARLEEIGWRPCEYGCFARFT